MKINHYFLIRSLILIILIPLKFNAQSSPPITPSALSRSDIPFSVRWFGYSRLPVDIKNEIINLPDDFNTKADEFYANRFLWTYREYVNHSDPSSGLPNPRFPLSVANYTNPRSSQYAIPIYIDTSQALDFYNNDSQKVNSMIALNLCGQPLRSIWEINQGWPVNRPDYNSDNFFQFQVNQVKLLVDDGNISFHQDNAGGNETSIDFGGSFNDASMTKFNDWLEDHKMTEFNNLGIGSLSNFNFKTYLLSLPNITDINISEIDCNCQFIDIKEATEQEINDPTVSAISKLKYFFREFQKEATITYYSNLHNDIDTYITSKNFGVSETKGTYSANNHERNKWLSPAFNFWISELYPKGNNESLIYDITEIARFGRSAFFENDDNNNIGDVVNSITVARAVKETNQNSIPLSYASGMTMITPWDVYIAPLDGNKQDRFYGDASDYSSLLSFIKNNKNLFDGYNTREEHIYSFLNYYEKVSSIKENDTIRDNLKLLRESAPQIIPAGSKVKIGTIEYTTTTLTETGIIYVPAGSTNTINENDLVYYLHLYNGNGSYTNYFDNSYRAKRPINNPDVDITTGFATSIDLIDSPERYKINWTGAYNGLAIPKGSKVMIGGIEFETIVETGVGLIYLSKNAGDYLDSDYRDENGVSTINDASIWYIKKPDGNIIYPTENKPFAITIRDKEDYSTDGVIQQIIQTSSPDKTSITWSKTNTRPYMSIPKGSKVLINDKEYTTRNESFNGTLHLASETYIPKNTIKEDDVVWYIKDNYGNIIYPQTKVNDAVMHIVNLGEQPKKVAVKIKQSLHTKFQYLFSPNSSAINKGVKTRTSTNIYTIENLEKWAIFARNNNTSKASALEEKTSISSEKVSIYPNPSKESFIVELLEKTENTNIFIYNSLGLKIFEAKNVNQITTINILDNSTGVYFVKIQTPKETITKKVIIE